MASPRKSTSRPRTAARTRGGDTGATRDRILRVAEDARETGQRSEQAEQHPGVKIATVAEVKDLIRDMPDQYLACRDIGHSWKIANVEKEGRGRGLTRTRTLYCPSCKYNKHQTFNYEGELIHETPDYPEGYLIKGHGKVSHSAGKGQFRNANMDRLIEKNEQKAASRK